MSAVSSGDRKIILTVDDSPTVRRSLDLAFSGDGHVVVTAEDAEEALRAMSDTRPDIVFVDFQLPGIDGLDLCRRLRAEATTRQRAGRGVIEQRRGTVSRGEPSRKAPIPS